MFIYYVQQFASSPENIRRVWPLCLVWRRLYISLRKCCDIIVVDIWSLKRKYYLAVVRRFTRYFPYCSIKQGTKYYNYYATKEAVS